jgi:hypothetical protein
MPKMSVILTASRVSRGTRIAFLANVRREQLEVGPTTALTLVPTLGSLCKSSVGRALFIQPPCRSYAPAGYQASISAG